MIPGQLLGRLKTSRVQSQIGFGQTKEHNMSDTSNRGFASMDEDRQREIAAEGGRAAHEQGTAHEFDSKEAREAGKKGGETVSQDREHMAEIGRRGGEARNETRST